MQNIFNVVLKQKQQINILKLNKQNLFLFSDINLRIVRCWSQSGIYCSVRSYYSNNTDWGEESIYILSRNIDRAIEREKNKNKYKIIWTKDYKNLNNLLSIKGLESNKLIDENNIRYLVFTLTNNNYNLKEVDVDKQDQSNQNNLSNEWWERERWDRDKRDERDERDERDIFYSVSLILMKSGIKDKNENENENGNENENENKKWLYKINLSKLQENYSLIKEGGQLDIYYVASSELEANVKEGYRFSDEDLTMKLKGKYPSFLTLKKKVNTFNKWSYNFK